MIGRNPRSQFSVISPVAVSPRMDQLRGAAALGRASVKPFLPVTEAEAHRRPHRSGREPLSRLEFVKENGSAFIASATVV